MFKRHQHHWRDVERTYDWAYLGDTTPHQIQWLLQWCEGCGRYQQTKIKGMSGAGPATLRTPTPNGMEDQL